MIKIKLNKKQTVPVELGPVTFEVDATDSGLDRIKKVFLSAQKKIAEIDDNATFEQVMVIIEPIMDEAFEAGVFRKVYDYTGSMAITMGAFAQAIDGVHTEMNKRSGLDKYIK
ncbi:hypothetical protein GQS40_06410|uniref:Uncharacterized protein n=1 Tax=Leuconostoc lactis TaxID=1246 RepID=A0A6L7ACT6_LEULA|nr:hypothetical protein [Leuconostoc lactis]MWN21303.1 hypothetical protein [Leuconostoc lactis]